MTLPHHPPPRTPNDEPPRFDPATHLTKLARRTKTADGGWRTVEQDYLDVKWRIVWLRDAEPTATIETALERLDETSAVFRATVTLEDGAAASGWGSETHDDWKDFIEKAETRALGRALAALGFGTQFCADFDSDNAQASTTPAPQAARATAATPPPSPQQQATRPEPHLATKEHAEPPRADLHRRGNIADPPRGETSTAAASPRQKDTRGTSPHKTLTPAQLSAIYAQAERYGVSRAELARRCAQHFDGLAPEALTVAQANDCLAGLRQLAPA